MKAVVGVLALCCLYGVLAQDVAVPGMPPVEEAAERLPEIMEPGIVLPEEGTFSEASESSEEEEAVLVRCKRPLCIRTCPYGYRTGRDGCPECICLENPCEGVRCDSGKLCRPKKCEAESCSVLESECVELPRDCPLRKCVPCPSKLYAIDEHGCRTCRCLEAEETAEPFEAVDPPPVPFEPVGEFGEPIGELVDPVMPCPMPMCAEPCPFGMKNNEFGCMTCECKEEPTSCEDLTCSEGLVCYMKKAQHCEDCMARPQCTVPSLCHSLLPMDISVLSDSVPPRCRDDGTFEPRQCSAGLGACWCVDDRGQEVDGTRVQGSLADEVVNCAENRTTTLHLSFQLLHEFDEDDLVIMIRSRDIHIVIQERISGWLSMENDHVIVVSVIPDGNALIVKTLIMSDGITDLPSAANHLGNRINYGKCNIDYRGKTLKPKADSVTVHHTYTRPGHLPHERPWDCPMRKCVVCPSNRYGKDERGCQTCECLEGEGGVREWRSFCHRHRSAMIAGSVGGVVFLMMMITLLAYVCKRRRSASAQFAHKRFENMENFKKNLIHSRDWEQPDLVVADKENKNVQLISSEPIV